MWVRRLIRAFTIVIGLYRFTHGVAQITLYNMDRLLNVQLHPALLYLYFQISDARRVCDGRKHSIDKKELNVDLYYKCMDLDINFEAKIPEPMVINDINRNILKFVNKATTYKDRLNSELKNTYGDIDWSSSADDELIITCTLDPKEKESVHLVKTWGCRCIDAVNGVIDTLDVNEDIVVQQEVKVIIRLQIMCLIYFRVASLQSLS